MPSRKPGIHSARCSSVPKSRIISTVGKLPTIELSFCRSLCSPSPFVREVLADDRHLEVARVVPAVLRGQRPPQPARRRRRAGASRAAGPPSPARDAAGLEVGARVLAPVVEEPDVVVCLLERPDLALDELVDRVERRGDLRRNLEVHVVPPQGCRTTLIAPWARSPATVERVRGASSRPKRCVISAGAISGWAAEDRGRGVELALAVRLAVDERGHDRELAHLRVEERDRDRLPRGRHERDRARRAGTRRTASSNPLAVPAASITTSQSRARSTREAERLGRAGVARRGAATIATSAPRWRATAPHSNPIVPAPTTPTRIPARSPARLHACSDDRDRLDERRVVDADAAPGSGDEARLGRRRSRRPCRRRRRRRASTSVVSRQSCGRRARHCAHVAARHERMHRDRGAVVEHARDLVAERVRREPGADHLEIGAADPRAAHAHAHARPVGRGHVDDADAVVGVAHGSHGRDSAAPLVCGRFSHAGGTQWPTSGSILGNPVLRKEDPGILDGRDRVLRRPEVAGLLHVAFVRSTIAHANDRGRSTRATRWRCRASSPCTPPTTSTCPTSTAS